MRNINSQQKLVIYQTKIGAIEFRGDFDRDTIWASQKQIAQLYGVDVRTINEHLKNIYQTGELFEVSTIRKFRIVQKEGNRNVLREINYYDLDAILSVGYRISSKQATQFRIWATKILKHHLISGFTINKTRIGVNHRQFTKAISEIKALLPSSNKIKTADIIDLINAFAGTWVSLNAYDKNLLPQNGLSKKQVVITVDELITVISELKLKLIGKQQASAMFGQESEEGNLERIIGAVFQSVNGKDAYSTLEEKAAHILYFIVKNHPFVDGNKRSGAFAFVWFLRKAKLLRINLTPEALTALTLLIAESKPTDKSKMIGLVLMLLK